MYIHDLTIQYYGHTVQYDNTLVTKIAIIKSIAVVYLTCSVFFYTL